jgi:HK97 family phage prohead protease
LFEVDAEKRTIFGLAVPYGEPTFSEGSQFQFSKGSLDIPENASRIKLLVSHERNRAVGHAVEFEDTDEGLWARFKVARGTAGDEALSMAEDGVWDGLSVGLRDGAKFSKKGKISHFTKAVLSEVSLTPDPAFDSARVAAVIAEAPNNRKEPLMATETNEDAVVAPAAFDYAEFAKAIAAELPKPVNPGAPMFEVNESAYAFDAAKGRFVPGGSNEFSTDLFASSRGDVEAGERVMEFIKSQFDVDRADVTSVNPNGQRPNLYVDQRSYNYPLWNRVNKGTLADGTPFVFPKFNTASGLVNTHTEAVEPTPGSFSATNQTVTPTAVSGKVEITREVYDAGGNPQVSNLIWGKMVNAYNEALEAAVVSTLNAAAASITDIALSPAGAVDAVLVDQLLAAFAGLQFERGGFAYDTLALHIDLYKALAAAKDSTGRKLLPIYGATNASGTARARFASLDIAGVEGIPSWALGATSTAVQNSWLFDSQSVHGWATAPQRLQFETRVAYVDLAIWGYRAVAISDTTGVRQITYDGTV